MVRAHVQDAAEHEIHAEMPPVVANGEDLAVRDSDAWDAAALRRDYCVDGGTVWIFQDGRLSPLPPLPGFSHLPATLHDLVFTAVAQYVTNRVAQTAEGNINAAVEAVMGGGEIPGSRDNDAYRAALRAWIAGLIDDQLGALPEGASAEAKKERAALIESEMEYDHENRLTLAVAAAKANFVRQPKERKRAKSAKKAPATSRLALPVAG